MKFLWAELLSIVVGKKYCYLCPDFFTLAIVWLCHQICIEASCVLFPMPECIKNIWPKYEVSELRNHPILRRQACQCEKWTNVMMMFIVHPLHLVLSNGLDINWNRKCLPGNDCFNLDPDIDSQQNYVVFIHSSCRWGHHVCKDGESVWRLRHIWLFWNIRIIINPFNSSSPRTHTFTFSRWALRTPALRMYLTIDMGFLTCDWCWIALQGTLASSMVMEVPKLQPTVQTIFTGSP